MKTGYLITARLKSTRLPRKLLLEVKGKPILAHMLDRLRLAKSVDEIIICTSTDAQDEPLARFADSEGVSCFRGHPEDVIRRLADAAEAHALDLVLNITADCPFADPVYADRIAEALLKTGADHIRALDLPHGAYSYGFRPEALRRVVDIKDSERTEVWGRYFTDTDVFDVRDLPIENDLHRWPDLRMTLDYPEDLAFFRAVFEELHQERQVFSLDEILALLRARPDIVAINSRCEELYLRRFTQQADIRLKPRHSVTRAAVIGCGSIGQRHIGNLRALGVTDIVALRSRRGHTQDLPSELGVEEVEGWPDLLGRRPDIAIVSNPTSLHLETMGHLLGSVRGVFMEKPLSHSLDGIQDFLSRVRETRTVTFVGHSLQFHPAILAIEEALRDERLGSPLALQCQVGHWLPDWHPQEDYRESYAARSDLGGGVMLTLIHEIHLAQELLGNVSEVSAFTPTSASLSLEVDTVADVMMRHSSGAISQIHLDFIQSTCHREGLLTCERGWIRYDLMARRVERWLTGMGAPEMLWDGQGWDPNEQYINAMLTFLRFVREGRVRHRHDARRATRSLANAVTALGHARQGRNSAVPAWVRSVD